MAKNLADFLSEKVEATSYRAVADAIGVTKGAVENIVKRTNKEPPQLPTLQGVAAGYKLPLWQVIEMAGFDLNLPTEVEIIRLYAYAEALPELAPFLQEIVDLPEDQRRRAIRAVRALLKDRGDDSALV